MQNLNLVRLFNTAIFSVDLPPLLDDKSYIGEGTHICYINTINGELPATFVSLRIIVYPAILCVNLTGRLDSRGGGPPTDALQAYRYMSYELSFGM
jgi:hypothetical protein